jgi:hypothetical protein
MPKFLRDGTGYYSTPSSDQSTVRSDGRAPLAKKPNGARSCVAPIRHPWFVSLSLRVPNISSKPRVEGKSEEENDCPNL